MKKALSLILALVLCFSLYACNDKDEESIEVKSCPHEELQEKTVNDGGCNIKYGMACVECGEFVRYTFGENHQYTEMTCTEASKCQDCGKIKQYALGHMYQKMESGEYVCSVCGYTATKDDYIPDMETETEAETQVKLSDTFDRVLASGIDASGNVFELVANETEDYNGTTIEMGVIKNNELSIPLTTENPFIGENGLLYQSYRYSEASGSIYDEEYAVFHYIGNGCFYYEHRIWNGNNNLAYYGGDGKHWPVVRINETEWIVDNDGNVILENYDGSNLQVLDTNTMTITELNMKRKNGIIEYCFPCSEGLFACMNKRNDVKTNGFYDLNGNMVIDLSGYKLAQNTYDTWGNGTYIGPTQNLVFKNGTCTFKITNDQGTDYCITIDKTGAVIDSKKLE